MAAYAFQKSCFGVSGVLVGNCPKSWTLCTGKAMSKCWDATPQPATTWDQRHFVVRQQRCVRRFPTLLLHRGQCLLSCGFLLTVWARPEVAIRYRTEVAIAVITGSHVHCLLLYERSVNWTHNGDVVRSMSKACQWLPTQTSIEIIWVELQICYQDVPIQHLGSDTGDPKWVPWFQSVTPAYSVLYVNHDLQIPFVRLSPGQASVFFGGF